MTGPAILVVDDSSVVQRTVHDALIADGYDAICASDGLEALDIIRSSSDIALILLDIDMPRMNGYQLCKMLKSDPEYSHIPIVMLTAKNSESDMAWGLKAGAEEYITKPFNYLKVKEALKRRLRAKQD